MIHEIIINSTRNNNKKELTCHYYPEFNKVYIRNDISTFHTNFIFKKLSEEILHIDRSKFKEVEYGVPDGKWRKFEIPDIAAELKLFYTLSGDIYIKYDYADPN